MQDVEKALLVLTQSLLVRMREDLMSSTKGVEHHSVSTQTAANSGGWVARPRTLRLTTRPRPSPNPDGSRPRLSNRVSKSCDLPSIAFSSINSTQEIAEKMVQDTLIPLFRRIHPETSGWNLTLINVCATNMTQLASKNQDGPGRDISRMFGNQKEVQKKRDVKNVDVPFDRNPQRVEDGVPVLTSATIDGEISKKASHDEREWKQTPVQETLNDEIALTQKELPTGIDDICKICGTYMPFFAILAHERFHALPD